MASTIMPATPTMMGTIKRIRRLPTIGCRVKAKYAPKAKNAPCAKFTTPIMPKMMDSPSAMTI